MCNIRGYIADMLINKASHSAHVQWALEYTARTHIMCQINLISGRQLQGWNILTHFYKSFFFQLKAFRNRRRQKKSPEGGKKKIRQWIRVLREELEAEVHLCIECNSASTNIIGLHYLHFIEAFSCMGGKAVWALTQGNQW